MSKKQFNINPDMLVQQMDGKTVVLDPESSKLFTLNQTCSKIISLLQKGLTTKQMAIRLMDEYQTSEKKALCDIESVIEQLKKEKVIVPYEA